MGSGYKVIMAKFKDYAFPEIISLDFFVKIIQGLLQVLEVYYTNSLAYAEPDQSS